MATSTIDVELLDTFTAALSGSALLPGDDGYDEARRIHNGLIDRRPALILLAIALVSIWRAGLITVIFAIVVPDVPRVVRLVRSIVLSVRDSRDDKVRALVERLSACHDWAERVLAAEVQARGGAFSVDGKMVDPPVLLLARKILQTAVL